MSFGGRGAGLRDLAENLSSIVGTHPSAEHFYSNLVPVFTRAFEDGDALSNEDVLSTVDKILKEETFRYHDKLGNERKRQGVVKDEDIDSKEVPQDVKDDIRRSLASVQLLSGIIKAKDRCILSHPIDSKACRMQREAANKAIEQLRGIDKTVLTTVAQERETRNLEVCSALAELAGTYVALAKRRADTLEQYLNIIKKNSLQLDLIKTGDWQALRNSLVKASEHKAIEWQDKVKQLTAEKDGLQNSKRMIILSEDFVRCQKSSGLFSWTMFGYGWAEHKYNRNGDAFAKYEVVKNHPCSETLHTNNPTSGILEITLRSESGQDLSVDIQTFREERDHPSTKARIFVLDTVIPHCHKQLADARNHADLLRTATEREHLKNILHGSLKTYEAQFEQEQVQWDQKVASSSHLTVGNAIEALEKLLLVMQNGCIMAPSLPNASASSIKDFLDVNSLLAKLHVAEELKKHAPQKIKEATCKTEPDARHRREHAAPVEDCSTLRSRFRQPRFISLFVRSAGRSLTVVSAYLKERQIPIGFALLFFAVPLPGVEGLALRLFQSAGVYVISSGVQAFLLSQLPHGCILSKCLDALSLSGFFRK